MVHRKSTYKLAFKNLSKDLRKNIFEENSILREKRRINELSHHSLDEIDDYCDCDVKESDNEDDDSDDNRNSNASDEESSDSGRQTDSEIDSSQVHHVEKSKKKVDASVDKKRSKLSKEEKKKKFLTLDEDKQRKCPKKVEVKLRRRKTESEYSHPKSPRSEDLDKNKVFPRRDFGFGSEANLLNLLQTLRTQERRTGVMKSSKATGEYDLIPARLKSVQKETKKKLKTPPLCRRLSSSDRNILTVRPLTAIVSMPIRSSSVTKKPELPPKERVTFSDDDIATVGTAHRLELRSSRREPRMKSYSTDHFSTDASLCHRCAQPIKQRGILT